MNQVSDKKERMNVYITTSKRHLPFGYAAIYSLFVNNQESEIFLYLVSEDIEEKDIPNEIAIAQRYGHHIIVVPFDEKMASKYTSSSDAGHWPMATMSCYWLFHKLLPEDVDRIMAIETDTVTIGSLYDVYHVDMHGNYMACPGAEHKPESHRKFMEELGGEVVTFVLSVYDVKKIRADFSLQDILNADKIIQNKAGRSQMEFAFGILFQNRITYIPGVASCLDENRKYVKELGIDYILKTEESCKLLHFSSYADGAKPWKPVELMPGYFEWWKYAKKSPYEKELLEKQWESVQQRNEYEDNLKKGITQRNIVLLAFMLEVIVLTAYLLLAEGIGAAIGSLAVAVMAMMGAILIRKLWCLILRMK